ncbi:hypothetical protein GCM10007905_00100 [Mixta theicola]|nr:hypothetical protein GCM10007905_00100 [Mixta theicola]
MENPRPGVDFFMPDIKGQFPARRAGNVILSPVSDMHASTPAAVSVHFTAGPNPFYSTAHP